MLRGVNQDQIDAAAAIDRLMVEGEGSIHEAMIAMSKAEGSFRLLMEMRNRLIDAVNRLLQSQV
jgi:flagellar hook-basal body complex protein FliE